MKHPNWLFLLAVVACATGAASCVSDDWDDDYGRSPSRYGQYDHYYYYDSAPPPRHYRDHHHGHRPPSDYDDHGHRDRHDRDGRDNAPPHAKPPKGFVLAGSFPAGKAVECGIPTSKKIKKIRVVGTSGSVSVNTVVLREGDGKTPFPVTRRLGPGETAEVDLGGARQATGLRISAGGKGTYDVFVH